MEDACPDQPEDRDGFEDSDGCPEPDNDGDGVLDGSDSCPEDAEDIDGFEDESIDTLCRTCEDAREAKSLPVRVLANILGKKSRGSIPEWDD